MPDGEGPPRRRSDDVLERLRRLNQRGAGGSSRRRRAAHRRARRVRRHWPRRTLIGVNVVTAVVLVASGATYGYVQWRLGQVRRVHISGLHAQGRSTQSRSTGPAIAPFTLLVIGSDTRNLGAGGGAQFGSSTQVEGQRSDSIILLRVVPRTRSLALLSIPRDTLVPIPGHGTTRINVAFNSGTPSLLVQVLDQDFGIQVNHVVQFNFDTFRAVADAVGGVEQWFPSPARDEYSLLRIPAAGCYNLVGDQALSFVRSREYQYEVGGQWHYQLYPESDLARIQRQQAFVRDLVKKAGHVAPTNIIELNNIIGSITKNLTLDSGFSDSLILDLAKDYRSANLSSIPSYTYPAVNSTAVPGALDPQIQQGRALIQKWLDVGQQTASAPASPATTSPPTSTSSVPAPTLAVDPSTVSIEVVDGGAGTGQTARAAQDLQGAGYRAVVAGTAPTSGAGATRIDYAPDSLAAAQQLAGQLGGGPTLVRSDALTPTPYNLEVEVGPDYQGLNPGSAPGAASTTTSTTSTTLASPAYVGTATVDPASSSTFHGVYVPPGLQPGQTPQTCGE